MKNHLSKAHPGGNLEDAAAESGVDGVGGSGTSGGEKPFKCQLCPYATVAKFRLSKHWRDVHHDGLLGSDEEERDRQEEAKIHGIDEDDEDDYTDVERNHGETIKPLSILPVFLVIYVPRLRFVYLFCMFVFKEDNTNKGGFRRPEKSRKWESLFQCMFFYVHLMMFG